MNHDADSGGSGGINGVGHLSTSKAIPRLWLDGQSGNTTRNRSSVDYRKEQSRRMSLRRTPQRNTFYAKPISG